MTKGDNKNYKPSHRYAAFGNTAIVTISIPPELLKDVDETLEKLHYISRSEFVREAIRTFVEQKAQSLPDLIELEFLKNIDRISVIRGKK